MEAIKAEIERKRKQLEDSKILPAGGKKYFKRSDLMAKNEEDYLKRHGLHKVDDNDVSDQAKVNICHQFYGNFMNANLVCIPTYSIFFCL